MLDAAGIPADVEQRSGLSLLVVRSVDERRARRELEDYLLEERQAPPPVEPPLLGGGPVAALIYATILVAASALDASVAGRAHAGAIVDGEWWRTVTALTLHVDAKHLFGNLIFGSVLGLMLSQALGGGVAWLAILVAGALGNAANALIQDPAHTAVGASTAVFAALGALVALALHRRRAVGRLRRAAPVVAGLLLLAWTGFGGERTDVMAHVTGFFCGLGVGALCGFVPPAPLTRRGVQLAAAAVALAIVVGAWQLALA